MQSARTRMRHQGTINVAISAGVLLVPVHGLVEPVLPRDQLLPPQLLQGLAVDGVTQVCVVRKEGGREVSEIRESMSQS